MCYDPIFMANRYGFHWSFFSQVWPCTVKDRYTEIFVSCTYLQTYDASALKQWKKILSQNLSLIDHEKIHFNSSLEANPQYLPLHHQYFNYTRRSPVFWGYLMQSFLHSIVTDLRHKCQGNTYYGRFWWRTMGAFCNIHKFQDLEKVRTNLWH